MAVPHIWPNGFYVYSHERADTGETFYIGKGRGKRAWTKRHCNSYWMRIARKHGFQVTIRQSGLSEACAFSLERMAIRVMRSKGATLTNLTDGGEGPAGRIFSAEAKHKMRLAKLGRSLTPEHAERIAAARRGKRWSEDQKERLRGRAFSDSHRRALSEKATGRKMSAEAVEKMASRKRGRPQSERARISLLGTRAGERNAHFSPIKHWFVHADHGRKHCTQFELRKTYNLPHGNLSKLVSGKRSIVAGWTLITTGE